jgi:hypothetical protein
MCGLADSGIKIVEREWHIKVVMVMSTFKAQKPGGSAGRSLQVSDVIITSGSIFCHKIFLIILVVDICLGLRGLP